MSRDTDLGRPPVRACSVIERSSRRLRRDPVAAETHDVAAVEMPNGQAVADEAFAWLNRQLSWQSTLADLERRRVRTS